MPGSTIKTFTSSLLSEMGMKKAPLTALAFGTIPFFWIVAALDLTAIPYKSTK